MLSILNVGHGDTKITFDPEKPAELEQAKHVVTDMLRHGYAILVQVGERDGKPLFQRATEFDEKTCEYIVVGVPEGKAVEASPKKSPRQRVKAEGTKAVGVARSAGGMSQAANSVEAWNESRRLFSRLGDAIGSWAGMPMPLEGHPLVIEPRWPKATEMTTFDRTEVQKRPKEAVTEEICVRSRFYSTHLRGDVVVVEENGKITHVVLPAVHSMEAQLHTLGASIVWGLEQEAAALALLATLISQHALRTYLLTGQFLESSERSGLTYLFRKLRPTVAISGSDGGLRILAALCMHPIAYYEGSWAGAMCPTDDVIAHLMLMRGDERLFWRRCNQHPPHRPEAGL